MATSPEGRRALIRWTTDHDVLVGLHDLNDVVACRYEEIAYDVLLILARRSPTDDRGPHAARCCCPASSTSSAPSAKVTSARAGRDRRPRLGAHPHLPRPPATAPSPPTSCSTSASGCLKVRHGDETTPLSSVARAGWTTRQAPGGAGPRTAPDEEIAAAPHDVLMTPAVLSTIMRLTHR